MHLRCVPYVILLLCGLVIVAIIMLMVRTFSDKDLICCCRSVALLLAGIAEIASDIVEVLFGRFLWIINFFSDNLFLYDTGM